MPIAIDGQVYKDEFEYSASQYVDTQNRPRITVTPRLDTVGGFSGPAIYNDTPTDAQKFRDSPYQDGRSSYDLLKREEQQQEQTLQRNTNDEVWQDSKPHSISDKTNNGGWGPRPPELPDNIEWAPPMDKVREWHSDPDAEQLFYKDRSELKKMVPEDYEGYVTEMSDGTKFLLRRPIKKEKPPLVGENERPRFASSQVPFQPLLNEDAVYNNVPLAPWINEQISQEAWGQNNAEALRRGKTYRLDDGKMPFEGPVTTLQEWSDIPGDNADLPITKQNIQPMEEPSPFEIAALRLQRSVTHKDAPEITRETLPLASAVTRLGTGLLNLVKFPGKVFKGEVDIQSEEGRKESAKWAAEMALTMVMAPAPLVAKSVDGTLGSIAGISAKTADKEMLKVAEVLDRKGYPNNEIWQTSGWYKGSDGQWRHEIPGSDKAKFYEPDTIKGYTDGKKKGTYETYDTGVRKDTTLGEVYEYPELYKAYPELKDMKVYWKTDNPKGFGEYNPDAQSIGINLDYIKKRKGDVEATVIHEVQHAIQAREGYTYGVTEEGIRNYLREATRIAIEEGDNTLIHTLHNLRQKYVEGRKLELNAELYKRSPAEREARMVEQRSKWTQKERANESPSFTRRRMDERDKTSEYRSQMFPDTSISPE